MICSSLLKCLYKEVGVSLLSKIYYTHSGRYSTRTKYSKTVTNIMQIKNFKPVIYQCHFKRTVLYTGSFISISPHVLTGQAVHTHAKIKNKKVTLF